MKQILKAVFLPSIRFRWIFGIISIAAVLYILLQNLSDEPVAYVAFLASALGLYYLITVTIIPLGQLTKAILMRNQYIKLYYEDKEFKARVTLYFGTMFNALYATFKLFTGIYFGSGWFIAIAIYYGILLLVRSTLARQDFHAVRNNHSIDEITQWKSYRRTGWLLLLMNIGLTAITLQVVAMDQSFSYPGTIIFVIAGYSFYRIAVAVSRFLQNRELQSPMFSATNIIDISFAVTSMFTLQTAMFASFAADDLDTHVPNIITGTAVALIITALAIGMIVNGTIKIRRNISPAV